MSLGSDDWLAVCWNARQIMLFPRKTRGNRLLRVATTTIMSQLGRLRALLQLLAPLWKVLRRLLCLDDPSPRRKALTITLVSLVLWSVWNGARTFDHPWGDLSKGVYTDHLSHMNAARVFPRIGRDLWRKPIRDIFRSLTDAEMARMPEDIRAGGSWSGGVYFVPGWPESKPLIMSWTFKSRMYPPGDLLFVAPIAALYHFAPISFKTTCRLLLGWFVLAAHVALFCFLLSYFEGSRSGIEWLGVFFLYWTMIYWALEGFYDCAAMVPLALCARYLGQRRGLAAIVAYCVAAFLHFRAFFLAPWALYAAFLVLKDRAWRRWSLRDIPAIVVAAVCAGASLYAFWLDLPALRVSDVTNGLLLSSKDLNVPMAWNVAALLVFCGGMLLWSRAWLDASVLAWLGLTLFTLRELCPWHLLIAMSWMGAPAERQIVRAVRVAFLVSVAALALGQSFGPVWLWRLYRAG